MTRRIIRPASSPPTFVEDANGESAQHVFNDNSKKIFFSRFNNVMTAFEDYLTEEAAPPDAIYVCELQGNQFVEVIPQTVADFSALHNFDGWPSPNGSEGDRPRNAELNEDGSLELAEDGSVFVTEILGG